MYLVNRITCPFTLSDNVLKFILAGGETAVKNFVGDVTAEGFTGDAGCKSLTRDTEIENFTGYAAAESYTRDAAAESFTGDAAEENFTKDAAAVCVPSFSPILTVTVTGFAE
ncbi:hypothetical protein F2Q68_00024750 [Brassica cretica]|uniref:Uncharacterized protein n=1 Tax=Brassica cretica TaxID=69181 RepID=A0A8S9IEL4_BRACR|nr:hypothetical protein F2Q68_00024750 [Brassica cretica]